MSNGRPLVWMRSFQRTLGFRFGNRSILSFFLRGRSYYSRCPRCQQIASHEFTNSDWKLEGVNSGNRTEKLDALINFSRNLDTEFEKSYYFQFNVKKQKVVRQFLTSRGQCEDVVNKLGDGDLPKEVFKKLCDSLLNSMIESLVNKDLEEFYEQLAVLAEGAISISERPMFPKLLESIFSTFPAKERHKDILISIMAHAYCTKRLIKTVEIFVENADFEHIKLLSSVLQEHKWVAEKWKNYEFSPLYRQIQEGYFKHSSSSQELLELHNSSRSHLRRRFSIAFSLKRILLRSDTKVPYEQFIEEDFVQMVKLSGDPKTTLSLFKTLIPRYGEQILAWDESKLQYVFSAVLKIIMLGPQDPNVLRVSYSLMVPFIAKVFQHDFFQGFVNDNADIKELVVKVLEIISRTSASLKHSEFHMKRRFKDYFYDFFDVALQMNAGEKALKVHRTCEVSNLGRALGIYEKYKQHSLSMQLATLVLWCATVDRKILCPVDVQNILHFTRDVRSRYDDEKFQVDLLTGVAEVGWVRRYPITELVKEANDMFDDMCRKKIHMPIRTINSLICLSKFKPLKAEKLIAYLKEEKLCPNEYTINALLIHPSIVKRKEDIPRILSLNTELSEESKRLISRSIAGALKRIGAVNDVVSDFDKNKAQRGDVKEKFIGRRLFNKVVNKMKVDRDSLDSLRHLRKNPDPRLFESVFEKSMKRLCQQNCGQLLITLVHGYESHPYYSTSKIKEVIEKASRIGVSIPIRAIEKIMNFSIDRGEYALALQILQGAMRCNGQNLSLYKNVIEQIFEKARHRPPGNYSMEYIDFIECCCLILDSDETSKIKFLIFGALDVYKRSLDAISSARNANSKLVE